MDFKITTNCEFCNDVQVCRSQEYVTTENGSVFRVCSDTMSRLKRKIVGGDNGWNIVDSMRGRNGKIYVGLMRYRSLRKFLRIPSIPELAVGISTLLVAGCAALISFMLLTPKENIFSFKMEKGSGSIVQSAAGMEREPLGKRVSDRP